MKCFFLPALILASKFAPSISSTCIILQKKYYSYEMGGIQSKNALPDDAVFKEDNNLYDVAAYKRICAEFGIDPSTDFRFTRGKNHGLGTVYIWVSYSGPEATDYHYPDPDLALFNDERVTNREDPNYKANGIYFV